MTNKTILFALLSTLAWTAVACSDDDDSDADSSWQGSDPHLSLTGTVAGEEFELSASGNEAADLGILYCERNYIVPDLEDSGDWPAEGYLEKVEIKFNYTRGEAFAEFQLELENEDLLNLVGEELTIGEDTGVNVGITVDEDGPDEEEFEGTAKSGTVKLELLSGEVGDDGLTIANEEGAFGIYVDVTLENGETVKGSFTALCGDNDLEIPE